MSQIQYRTTDGSTPRTMTREEADALIAQPHVADACGMPVQVVGADTEIEAACYEIYGEGETPEDYPDGDPYADHLVILPAGYEWAGQRARRADGGD